MATTCSSEYSEIFQAFKAICVPLVDLTDPGLQSTSRHRQARADHVNLLLKLLHLINSTDLTSLAALFDYVFYPISTIFRLSTAKPGSRESPLANERSLQLALQCLAGLLKADPAHLLHSRDGVLAMFNILLQFMSASSSGNVKSTVKAGPFWAESEEVRSAAIAAMYELFRACDAGLTSVDPAFLTAPTPIPSSLGHSAVQTSLLGVRSALASDPFSVPLGYCLSLLLAPLSQSGDREERIMCMRTLQMLLSFLTGCIPLERANLQASAATAVGVDHLHMAGVRAMQRFVPGMLSALFKVITADFKQGICSCTLGDRQCQRT